MNRLIRTLFIIGVLGLVACFLILILYLSHFHDAFSARSEVWGTFGDFIGGTLSPVLAFFALIAVLSTFYYQNLSIQHQNFEHSYFEMLRLYNEIVKDLEYLDGGLTRRGRSCFEHLFKDCEHKFISPVSNGIINSSGIYTVSFEEGYSLFMEQNGHLVGHYFRNLYRIFKFVDNTDDTGIKNQFDDDIHEKKFYTGILRAQLSRYELGLLFYQSLFWKDGKPFKDYIEKYALLENMDITISKLVEVNIFNKNLLDRYSESAYGRSYEDIINAIDDNKKYLVR